MIIGCALVAPADYEEVLVVRVHEAILRYVDETRLHSTATDTAPAATTRSASAPAAAPIIDAALTDVMSGNFAKVFAWYDNEWGYSNRLVELAKFIGNTL